MLFNDIQYDITVYDVKDALEIIKQIKNAHPEEDVHIKVTIVPVGVH